LVNVGNAGFSAERISDEISLAFKPSGQPYVAFSEGGQDSSTVMKFDGDNWVNVGNTGFTKGKADNISIALSPTGQPYVAFVDYTNSQKVTVMKYDSIYSVINELQRSVLSIYPNPAIDKITIETSVIPAKSQLSITNLNGQQLITQQITESKMQIDISYLPNGVYFVRLTNDRTVEVGKIIKQ
jgi:DNA-binding beta-propeller fold protein YncE